MGLVVLAIVAGAGFIAAVVFGFRWTRPSTNDTLRRADDLEAEGTLDPKTIRQRIYSALTIYGPRN